MMISHEIIKQLSSVTDSKIVMVVLDGLGGLPDEETGKTELETAHTPYLDRLALNGICGLSDPVAPGITPGSGPGHLALFGYDPLQYTIGRGVMEALGIGFKLQKNDIAGRGNFCTIDDKGIITDRRAGRISTEKNVELCAMLNQITLDDIEVFVEPVKEHRFALVLRGENLSDKVSETDPQRVGVQPSLSVAETDGSKRTAELINQFSLAAKQMLSEHNPANMVLLRGLSMLPDLDTMNEVYKLSPAAIARYPMYKGLARLLGMEIYEVEGDIEEELDVLQDCYDKHDFFFIHIKGTDSAGEDGDFKRKVDIIQKADTVLSRLDNLHPDVIIVTGDHSTPALLKGHSWHPVPCLIQSKYCRPDKVKEFSEFACSSGSLGRFSALNIMPIAMANALKLAKYGA
jgi:2,3-bisphosphoglycerate-independent phosphoglycerate mutase